MRVRLLPNEETDASSPLSAECLRFETVGKIMEEGRTGVDGGIDSSSLDSAGNLSNAGGVSFDFTGSFGVGGPIPLPVATAV
jgi:hypothetical protein